MESYSWSYKLLHWLMAALIFLMFFALLGFDPAMTDAEAKAKCEELAAAFLVDIAAHYRRMGATGEENGEGYARAMLAELDKLGEPTGLNYHDACEAIRAQVK